MREPRRVLRETVLALHEHLLAEFGGLHGMRDEGMFDSALLRARQQYVYGEPDLAGLAAA